MQYIKKDILGYKFLNEQDCVNSIQLINTHYGYPKSDSVTSSWCKYIYDEIDGFYYIIFDESLKVILGEPEIITINEKTIFNELI